MSRVGERLQASRTNGSIYLAIRNHEASKHSRHRAFFWRDGTNASSGTVPTSDTLVSGMEVNLGTEDYDRVAFVSFACLFTGDHTNRFSIYLNGTQAFPTGDTGVIAHVNGGNSSYTATVSNIPIAVAAGAAGDLEVRWNASDTTTAVTFIERSVTAYVHPGTWAGGTGELEI